ncbi:MAG: hypothetical protein QW812_05995 [Thermoplasmataceae archaeon]
MKVKPTRENIKALKSWIFMLIKTSSVVTADGITLDPVEFLAHEALRVSLAPPYRLLNLSLLRSLNVFNYGEMEEIFGQALAGMLYRKEYQIDELEFP